MPKYAITVYYTPEALEERHITEQIEHYRTHRMDIDEEKEILWMWVTQDNAWGIYFRHIEFYTVRFIRE